MPGSPVRFATRDSSCSLSFAVAIIATNQVRRAVTNSVNDSFRVIRSGMVTAIVNAWQSGAIRDTDMVRALQRLDLIDPADDPETVIDAIRNGAPNLISRIAPDCQALTIAVTMPDSATLAINS
jgi:hypothetical protein